ncbi:C13 family peptidase [Flavobacterium sp. MXW15]|uniref:C13 family peptidase n=1 Tax=Xanthomonas chitinilytica TaxID=2989819 RepID=A0ABT3JW62_9XANT|nr:C13 family peptidase [Xanthomonas sp. H13-6]MCW4455108.1 C13 family peptidase [Flavobacterium sp. MXW15]MCW4472726.1 C13 family peptidase [Xanthomonas sp. H13-6]
MHRHPALRSLLRHLRPVALAIALSAGAAPTVAGAADLPAWKPTTPALEGAELARLDAALGQLQPQRPGIPDLYVLGVAGDADEDVFRNEVLYLQQLSAQRFGAGGRSIGLINHPENRTADTPAPIATWESLGYALDALGRMLDPDEDILLLYMTSHGLEDSSFYLQTAPGQEDVIAPDDLARLLDEAGIGNAVIVVSACYSGGFIPALQSPRRMVITAARHDRPSFGCGNSDSATWFGRAFLVEALNETQDFKAAFQQARAAVRRREKEEGELPSEPQFQAGRMVVAALEKWRAELPETAAVPYPFVHRPTAAAPAPANRTTSGRSNRKER